MTRHLWIVEDLFEVGGEWRPDRCVHHNRADARSSARTVVGIKARVRKYVPEEEPVKTRRHLWSVELCIGGEWRPGWLFRRTRKAARKVARNWRKWRESHSVPIRVRKWVPATDAAVRQFPEGEA